MPYYEPKTFAYKETLSSSDLNKYVRDNVAYLKNAIDSLVAVPIGLVAAWLTDTPPSLFRICNGDAISRTTYVDLFTLIGVTFGNGNGTTTFNIPDFKGKVLIGKDSGQTEFDAIAETGGAKTTNIDHNHSVSITTGGPNNLAGVDGYDSGGGEVADQGHTHSVSGTTGAASVTSVSVLNPYVVINWIVKVS